MARYNAEFGVKPAAKGTAFIPYIGGHLPEILCEQHVRVVGNDNCVRFGGLKLQIPADGARHHYVKVMSARALLRGWNACSIPRPT